MDNKMAEKLHERLNRHDDRIREVETGMAALKRLPDSIDKLTDKISELGGMRHEVEEINKTQRQIVERMDEKESKDEERFDAIENKQSRWEPWIEKIIAAIAGGSLLFGGYKAVQNMGDDSKKENIKVEGKEKP